MRKNEQKQNEGFIWHQPWLWSCHWRIDSTHSESLRQWGVCHTWQAHQTPYSMCAVNLALPQWLTSPLPTTISFLSWWLAHLSRGLKFFSTCPKPNRSIAAIALQALSVPTVMLNLNTVSIFRFGKDWHFISVNQVGSKQNEKNNRISLPRVKKQKLLMFVWLRNMFSRTLSDQNPDQDWAILNTADNILLCNRTAMINVWFDPICSIRTLVKLRVDSFMHVCKSYPSLSLGLSPHKAQGAERLQIKSSAKKLLSLWLCQWRQEGWSPLSWCEAANRHFQLHGSSLTLTRAPQHNNPQPHSQCHW